MQLPKLDTFRVSLIITGIPATSSRHPTTRECMARHMCDLSVCCLCVSCAHVHDNTAHKLLVDVADDARSSSVLCLLPLDTLVRDFCNTLQRTEECETRRWLEVLPIKLHVTTAHKEAHVTLYGTESGILDKWCGWFEWVGVGGRTLSMFVQCTISLQRTLTHVVPLEQNGCVGFLCVCARLLLCTVCTSPSVALCRAIVSFCAARSHI